MPVVLLGRNRITEDNAGGNRIGSLDVRVVETLDMNRKFLHSQLLLERLHDHVPIGIRIRMFLLFKGIQAHLLCISRTKFKQGQLVAPHRDTELHSIDGGLREERHYHFA